MEIIYLDEVESTQLFLIEKIKKKELLPPVAVITKKQTDGVGSRGNRWIGEEGNLFLSFALKKSSLPDDIPNQSLSIYFSYILKEILSQKGSKIWLKWPNDFYIEDRKVGGTLTTKIKDIVVCGIGLNVVSNPAKFGKLDISIDLDELIDDYFSKLKEKISWKEIFSKYKLEFHKRKNFSFTYEGKKVFADSAKLCEDGSLKIDKKRIYSLR